MTEPPVDRESGSTLHTGFRNSGLTSAGLWLRAMSIGGWFRQAELTSLTSGDRRATRAEHDLVAAALNEHFFDLGQDHPVPYWEALGRPA